MVGLQSAVTGEQGRRPQEKLALQLQQRHKNRRSAGHADVIVAMHGHESAKETGVDVLPHESLGDADAADRFGQGGAQTAPGSCTLRRRPLISRR